MYLRLLLLAHHHYYQYFSHLYRTYVIQTLPGDDKCCFGRSLDGAITKNRGQHLCELHSSDFPQTGLIYPEMTIEVSCFLQLQYSTSLVKFTVFFFKIFDLYVFLQESHQVQFLAFSRYFSKFSIEYYLFFAASLVNFSASNTYILSSTGITFGPFTYTCFQSRRFIKKKGWSNLSENFQTFSNFHQFCFRKFLNTVLSMFIVHCKSTRI